MAVATVEEKYLIAIQQSSGGSPVAVVRQRRIFYMLTADNEDERSSVRNIRKFVSALVISVIYGAMMVLGAIHYHDCPETGMALYTVVQGVTVMFNMAVYAIWLMWRCVSYKPVFYFCLIIFLFNLVWCVVGASWISNSPCKFTQLYWYAVGFSIPIWIILVIYCCTVCSCRNNDN